MRDSNEKKDAVAHWEAQIAEIIQWYVNHFSHSIMALDIDICKVLGVL